MILQALTAPPKHIAPLSKPSHASQWLSQVAWQSAFPQFKTLCSYHADLPQALLAQLCAAKLGQPPARVVVEQPWQGQLILQQCIAYLTKNGIACAPLPQVLTLGQWLVLDAPALQLGVSDPLTERQAALTLCNALKMLRVQSITSDAARYALAGDMVVLLKEIDYRAQLSPQLAAAGQGASERLSQTAWLSREASWLAVARDSLHSVGKPLAWQLALQASQRLASGDQLAAIFPAAHPSLAMQVFLSHYAQANHQSAAVCVPVLASSDAGSAVRVLECAQFEQEAVACSQHIQTLMHAASPPQHVVVVAHDRVLGRRCAALLARAQVPVEDRVGWALSTTVAATVLRSLLGSWQGSDVPALIAWLALPVVAAQYPYAKPTLVQLRRLWYAQTIEPRGAAFVRYALKKTESGDVKTLLNGWQAAQVLFSKPHTIAQFASALQAFLASISASLQADAAGGKVWRHLQALSAETDDTLVSLATFVAVLDEALESERFSASTHNHADDTTARVIFVPLYEAAWTGDAPVVMLGCNESHFPASPQSPTPLLNSVRRELELPLPSTELAVWQHLLAQQNKLIVATYSPNEQGNPSRLSPWLLGAQCEADEPATGKRVLQNIATQPLQPRTIQAAQISIASLPTDISVTKLATVLQCPYRFALNAVFGVQALDEPATWPAHLERGNLLHEALHRVQLDLQRLATGSEIDLAACIQAALQAVLQEKLPFSGRYAALVADSQRTLSTYVSAHKARQQEGWRLQAAEHPIESHYLIDGVRVHGKLDRFDVIRDAVGEPQGYAVLDYKTSNDTALRQKRDTPLLDAQLAIYAALLEHQDMPAAQAAYWRLHDGLHEASTPKLDYHSKKTIIDIADLPLQIDGIQTAVRSAWQTLADSGAAPAMPSNNACQHCQYKAVCRSSDLIADGEEADDE